MENKYILHCRFCAEQKTSSDIHDLITESDLNAKIQMKLSYFNIDYIDLSPESLVPKSICNSCLHSLNNAYEFFLKAKKCQAILNEIFVKTESSNSSGWYVPKTETIENDLIVKNELSPAHSESDEVLSNFLLPAIQDDFENNIISNHCTDVKPNFCPCGNDTNKCSTCNYENKPKKSRKRKSVKSQKSKRHKKSKLGSDESWTGYKWECQLCNAEYSDINKLRAHTKTVHSKCFAMNCSDCTEVLESFVELIAHIRWHRHHLKYYCHYCNYKYKKVPEEIDHVSVHHAHPQKVCEGCGEIFPNEQLYQSHVDTYNPPKPKPIPYKRRETPITIKDLTCDICFKVSKSVGNLKIHKQRHTKRTRDFTCEICGSAFYTKGVLSSHSVVHKSVDPSICKICSKPFKTLIRLKKHLKTHYAEKPYKCDQCNRGFRLKEQLKNHMIIHTDEIPYPCPYCSKGFKFKSVLTTHLNQHTGVKPYACTECTMDFSSWSNCNKHMKRKHGKTLAKNILTPHGRVPVNEDGTPKILTNLDSLKDIEKDVALLHNS